ncbi:YqjF family protein [Rhodopirellula sp. MGV]|uniref:YqjF family protein n=1 Tax=Rhodopirellula sp. MGV TaxID=2023130 RepID=UPI000B96B527|nr:DUF2071 domain-containing protein [Rhodopirellula sp. MGV]OYP36471.1 hypothetical protein CGZ80_08925 [Rhodopirellula sp. MGV]PNY36885.1 DUF2071 domain-containing protein [Rhodopirellula baltica]
MRWSELCFAHWPAEPSTVAKWLPPGVELDTYEGSAWVGVVPFLMSDVAPRCCPAVPGISRFPELNVRTYVSVGGKPGVWFFSLDAASRFAVRLARTTFHLPYMDAKMNIHNVEDGAIEYQSRRTHRGEATANFSARYKARGDYAIASPGSFEHWLTARYCLYSASPDGRVYRGEINHPPWELAQADYEQHDNSMGQALGFDFDREPHVLVAKSIDVRAWLITGCPRVATS